MSALLNRASIYWIAIIFGAVAFFRFLFFDFSIELVLGGIIVLSLGILLLLCLERMANLYLILIFLTPFAVDFQFGTSLKLSLPTEGLLILISIVFIWKLLAGFKINFSVWKHPLFLLLILDVMWCFICAIQSDLPDVAFKRSISKFMYVFVFTGLLSVLLNSTKAFTQLFWLYGLGCVIPIMSTLFHHAQWGYSQATSPLMCQPFFEDHTIYAACLAFVIPYFLLRSFDSSQRASLRMRTRLITSLLIVALLLSYSRAAWLSVIVAGGFYLALLLKVKFKWVLVVSLGLVIAGLFSFQSVYKDLQHNESKYGNGFATHLTSASNLKNDESNLERINRWVCAYRMSQDKPLFGFGPGTYQFEYDGFQTSEFMTRISTREGDKGNAHSEYLMALSETGWIGMFLFVGVLIYSIYLGMKLYYECQIPDVKLLIIGSLLGLVTFFVHGLFNTFSDYDKMALLMLGSLGILAVIHSYNWHKTIENE